MRMLSDEEIVDRIYNLLKAMTDGTVTSTSALFAKIKIDPEELLPVGSLTGIHNRLICKVKECIEFNIEFLSPTKTTLPQHAPYCKKSQSDNA